MEEEEKTGAAKKEEEKEETLPSPRLSTSVLALMVKTYHELQDLVTENDPNFERAESKKLI